MNMQTLMWKAVDHCNNLAEKLEQFQKREFLLLTVTEVGAAVDFPDDLSFVRAIDAAVLIVQKVLRQGLIWEERLTWWNHTYTPALHNSLNSSNTAKCFRYLHYGSV